MNDPKRQDFRLIHRLRVRWAEVDQQRIVFNPHYLMYVDNAFADYWRALAIPYQSIPDLLGGDVYVKKSSVEYHGSARLDDMLEIGLQCARIGNSSMIFRSGIFRGETLLVSAELVYVFADPTTQTSKPVPAVLRELMLSYEAGAVPVDIRVSHWDEVGPLASVLRREVFNDELGIVLDLAQDAADLTALHASVRNRFGQLLATGRLTAEGLGAARIGRVAVHRAMRGTGFGRAVIEALLQAAGQRGETQVVLSAPCSAQNFYARLGFETVGDVFVEAGVPHIRLSRTLSFR